MDNKIRVHELAKQLKSTSKRIIEMLSEIGIFNKSYMSTLEDEELQAFYNHIGYHPDAGKKQETIGASAIGAGSSEKTASAGGTRAVHGAGQKSSGIVVRRIIHDQSSFSEGKAQNPQGGTPSGKKQFQRQQSRTASSGLRSGYEVRSAESYEALLSETQERQKNESVADLPENTAAEPAAQETTTVRRIKRIAKNRPAETGDAEVQRPETKKEGTEAFAAGEQTPAAGPAASIAVPDAEKNAEQPAAAAPAVKTTEPISKVYHYQEEIVIDLPEPEGAAKSDDKNDMATSDAAKSENLHAEAQAQAPRTEGAMRTQGTMRSEPAVRSDRPAGTGRPDRYERPARPDGTDRSTGRFDRGGVRPQELNRDRSRPAQPAAGSRNPGGFRNSDRPRTDRPRDDRPRDGRNPGAGRLSIPAVDPAVAASQEPRRDFGSKNYDKNIDRPQKKDGKKDPSRLTPSAKEKYKPAKQLVGDKKGVSELLNDDVVYEVESVPLKKGSRKRDQKSRGRNTPVYNQPVIAVLTNVKLPENITVKDFAEKIKKTSADVIKKLMLMGIMANQNQVIDFDTAAIIAGEYGITAEQEIVVTDEELLFEDPDDAEIDEEAVSRPPVVVVMGHVDHGKTSLLDAIRSTSVTAGEAGGITQHIGAYMVKINDRKITFLDTPGHEAFTAMRARGAQVTDVAILVVAADDGVMPQTVEAINHAKAANVSIVIAVNKIDKPGANVDRVMQELTEYEIVPEAWGGDIPFVPVSAKTGENIGELLETVLLSADILELKANPNKQAKGTIIEAKLDKNRGPVATLLVQRGTLKPGDAIISGTTFGHIRTMTDDRGRALKKAGPSMPVEITGLPEVPEAGEVFYVVTDERLAKHLIDTRKNELRARNLQSQSKVSLDDLFAQIQEGKVKDLNLIIKADVQGSVEAVKQSLEKLSNDQVRIRIIHGAVGAITESDVTLAEVSNAIIIGFNVRPGASVAEHAEAAGVDLRLYRIIYDAIDDIKAAMTGMLDPEYKEVVIGHVEIRQTFKVSGIGTIAGCYVTNGKIIRNSDVRIVRNGIVIYEGKLASLKRFKDDVKEVQQGFECGLSFERFNDIKEGDEVECYIMEEIKRQ